MSFLFGRAFEGFDPPLRELHCPPPRLKSSGPVGRVRGPTADPPSGPAVSRPVGYRVIECSKMSEKARLLSGPLIIVVSVAKAQIIRNDGVGGPSCGTNKFRYLGSIPQYGDRH